MGKETERYQFNGAYGKHPDDMYYKEKITIDVSDLHAQYQQTIASLKAENAELKAELAEFREAAAWYLECKKMPPYANGNISWFKRVYGNILRDFNDDAARIYQKILNNRASEWTATKPNALSALRALLDTDKSNP